MPSTISKYFLLLTIIFGCACTKVINVNLNDASAQIVIEGNITNAAGPYKVQITKTVNFSADNIYPAVTGAAVIVTDSTTSLKESLNETAPGIYTTSSTKGLPGHTYLLQVSTGGKTYTASSVMPQPVLIDSVSFNHNGGFSGKRINPIVYFSDPAGIANYYVFNQFINNKLLDNTFVFSDRLSDGKYIAQQLFSDSNYIKVNDVVTIQMKGVDKNVCNYFNTLVLSPSNNSATPANPVSNITGGALGYFSANTIASKTVTAK